MCQPALTVVNEAVIEEHDCVDGELPKKSFVKLSKLFTVHSTLVLKKICALRGEKIEHLRAFW